MKTSHRVRHPLNRGMRECRGVGLIEILVTILILAIGLLGLAGLQGVSTRNNNSAYLRTQATTLAYDIVDAMRANLTAARNGAYNINYGASPSSADAIAQAELTTWRANITAILPTGTALTAAQQSQITQGANNTFTINIRWDDSRGADAVQVFTVTTRL